MALTKGLHGQLSDWSLFLGVVHLRRKFTRKGSQGRTGDRKLFKFCSKKRKERKGELESRGKSKFFKIIKNRNTFV